MQVAITGAAGFIGAHLVDFLCKTTAYHIVAIDSFKYGSTRLGALTALYPGRITVVCSDLSLLDVQSFLPLFSSVDYVFHLAAEKLHNTIENPSELIRSNITLTYNLLASLNHTTVRKVVFASSLYANGNTTNPCQGEADKDLPETLYGVTKLAGEGFIRHFLSQSVSFDLVAARLYFVYGPNQDDGLGYPSVISSNFKRIIKGEAPIIKGSGTQSLDYTFVDDVVQALSTLCFSETSQPVYNVCSGSPVSINYLTQIMLNISNSCLTPVHVQPDWTENTTRSGCSSLITRELGWIPTTSLADGLTATFKSLI